MFTLSFFNVIHSYLVTSGFLQGTIPAGHLWLTSDHKLIHHVLQAYTALLGSAVKCGEAELAVDVYNQLRNQVQ